MLEFFEDNNVPFQDMSNEDALSSNANSWCLRKPGEAYVVYLKNGGTTNLDLSAASGDFEVRWYDPRNGGGAAAGSVASVTGGSTVSLGTAPVSTALRLGGLREQRRRRWRHHLRGDARPRRAMRTCATTP